MSESNVELDAEKGSLDSGSISRNASIPQAAGEDSRSLTTEQGVGAPKPQEPTDKQPPIDHGSVAWLQCLGAFCIFFCSWGMIGGYGAFQSFYEASKLPHSSPSAISWIGSLQGTLMLFGSALVGPLYDCGYFKLLLPVGSICTVLGMMLTSISTKYWHFILTQGVLNGIGLALIFLPTLASLPTWFVKRRALAISLASSGSGIGGILFPIIFNNLQPRIGFGWTVRTLAFILLALLLLANLFWKQRTKPAGPRKLFDASAWRDGPYVLVAITSLLGYVGIYIPFFYMQVYATSGAVMDVKASIIPYLLPLINVGYSIGRVVPGVVADRIGAFNTLIPCLLASGILAFCWNAVHSDAGLIVWCILFGFISAPLGSLDPATIVGVTPDLSALGVWMGMMFVPLGTGLLIGAPIGGAILDGTGDYLYLQVFCGCALIGSSVALAASRILKTGVVLKVKY
ncbi:related to monocarboxylate transporter [Ramularia collo-cygni]|uniref:Related to monocarboxylate transporter n=1 Tax=Ramularia collo-cygni TaxID=112498 RepID=A0A2D3UUU8_9PEZI|nr:related to monocarboxylate transporter [Ramularia collo-cygni]CZT14716.1 related to monocarboxylate transporter [Ramularia collo-cygni]